MGNIDELVGVLPALVSPLTKGGSVDAPAVVRLVEHVVDGGVTGLLVLGSTGEIASLDERSRRTMLSAVMEAARGRVPVICGVAQSHLRAAMAEVEAAARSGAAAALVTPPFYYPIDQASVLAFYRALAAESRIPILLYNIPQNTKIVAEPETVSALAHEGAIAGIKDSSRDFEYFERVCILMRDLPRFRTFTGSDTMLLPSLVMGASGTICGGANVAPQWIVRIHDEFRRGELEAARTHQDEVVQLILRLRGGVFPGSIKAALSAMKICEPWLAPPIAALDKPASDAIAEWLQGKGLLVGVSKSV